MVAQTISQKFCILCDGLAFTENLDEVVKLRLRDRTRQSNHGHHDHSCGLRDLYVRLLHPIVNQASKLRREVTL